MDAKEAIATTVAAVVTAATAAVVRNQRRRRKVARTLQDLVDQVAELAGELKTLRREVSVLNQVVGVTPGPRANPLFAKNRRPPPDEPTE